jgi:predicted nucleotidyltransferase
MRDVERCAARLVLVGAWMTRVWLVVLARHEALRRTNDIDLALTPEVAGTTDLAKCLLGLGYAQNVDYTFRYERMSADGLLIIDLLVDQGRSEAIPDAYAVYGLDTAIESTSGFVIEVAGRPDRLSVTVPTLPRAVLLRALALDQGPASIKFTDYAADFVALARAVDLEDKEFAELRTRPEFTRAREVALPLFGSPDSPGSRAVAQGAAGDPELAARTASIVVRDLFERSAPLARR